MRSMKIDKYVWNEKRLLAKWNTEEQPPSIKFSLRKTEKCSII